MSSKKITSLKVLMFTSLINFVSLLFVTPAMGHVLIPKRRSVIPDIPPEILAFFNNSYYIYNLFWFLLMIASGLYVYVKFKNLSAKNKSLILTTQCTLIIATAYCLQSKTTFEKFNPERSSDLGWLVAYDKNNTKYFERKFLNTKLEFIESFEGLDKPERFREFYSNCKFGSNMESYENKIFSLKGKEPYLNGYSKSSLYHIVRAGAYCEYRMKTKKDLEVFNIKKGYNVGDLLFIDELIGTACGRNLSFGFCFDYPRAVVIKRHYK